MAWQIQTICWTYRSEPPRVIDPFSHLLPRLYDPYSRAFPRPLRAVHKSCNFSVYSSVALCGANPGLYPFPPSFVLKSNSSAFNTLGFAIQGAYTWPHVIDNSSDPLVPTAGNQEFPRNSFDLAAERGNSDFDVRQRLVLNYTSEIPVGRGHSHVAGGRVGKILEGWQLAGITTFSSGLPLIF
jgi:hypothetical protein